MAPARACASVLMYHPLRHLCRFAEPDLSAIQPNHSTVWPCLPPILACEKPTRTLMQQAVYKTKIITPATAASSPPATLRTAPLVWFTADVVGTLPVADALGSPAVELAASAALLDAVSTTNADVAAASLALALALALTSAVELG